MHELSISVAGERIEAQTFLEAVSTFLRLLRAVDTQQAVRWRLATLRYSSPAVVGFVGEPRSKKKPDVAAEVAHTLVSGLASLDRGERPAAFQDDALELSKRLAELKGRGGVESILLIDQDARLHSLAITPRVAASVDEFIGIKYESIGAIEGRLELVSSHGGMLRCNVYERVLGRPVVCDVSADLKRAVLEAFDQEVRARGIVKRDASGQARQIRLESLEVIPPSEKPPESLAGLAADYTDGSDTVEYVKSRWK